MARPALTTRSSYAARIIASQTADQLRAGGRRARLVLEPLARNTAPGADRCGHARDGGGRRRHPRRHARRSRCYGYRIISQGDRRGREVRAGRCDRHHVHRADACGNRLRVHQGRPADAQLRRMATREVRREAASRTRAPVRQLRRVLVERGHFHRARVGVAQGHRALPAGHLCRLPRRLRCRHSGRRVLPPRQARRSPRRRRIRSTTP